MARKPKADDYADLVRQSRAGGMTLRAARAHARKILAAQDVWIVDPKTGKSRLAPTGRPILGPAQKRKGGGQ